MLTTLVNFRDLGGLPAHDGRVVAPGRVYRSDALTHLSDADRDHLRDELGVRHVVDLRSGLEHERLGRYDPERLGVTVHEIALLDGAVMQEANARGDLSMAAMYRAIADHGAAALRTVTTMVADGTHLPLVVACTGGKDRTGVFVALLLSALGVPRPRVVEDYLRSAAGLDALRRRVEDRMNGDGVVVPPDAFSLDADALVAVLDEVDAGDGSLDRFLGGADVVAGLRRHLLVAA